MQRTSIDNRQDGFAREALAMLAGVGAILLLLLWTWVKPASASVSVETSSPKAVEVAGTPPKAAPAASPIATARAIAHMHVEQDVAPRPFEFDREHELVLELGGNALFCTGLLWIGGRQVCWSLRLDQRDGEQVMHPSGVYVDLPERHPELSPKPVCTIPCRTLREWLGLSPQPAREPRESGAELAFASATKLSAGGATMTTATTGVIRFR